MTESDYILAADYTKVIAARDLLYRIVIANNISIPVANFRSVMKELEFWIDDMQKRLNVTD